MTAFNPPRKRKREKRDNNRKFPGHLRFVKGHQCCIPECPDRNGGQIEPHHLRTAANSGTGLKPPDWFTVPLCPLHHARVHSESYEALGLDMEYLFKTAAWLAARTPDKKMRLAMKEQE